MTIAGIRPTSCWIPHVTRHLLWLGVFLALAVAVTWPLAARIDRATAGDLGDSLLNVYVLDWNYHTLLEKYDWSAYWRINMYWPHELTMAMSEHLFGQALLGLPVFLLTGDCLVTLNCLLILNLALNGYAAAVVGYYYARRWIVGLAAGLVLFGAPGVLIQAGHLHCTSLHWQLWCWLAFQVWLRRFGAVSALLGGAAAAMALLSGMTVGFLFLAMFCPVAVLMWLRRGGYRRWRSWATGALWLLVLGMPGWLFLAPYAKLAWTTGYHRTLHEMTFYGNDLISLTIPLQCLAASWNEGIPLRSPGMRYLWMGPTAGSLWLLGTILWCRTSMTHRSGRVGLALLLLFAVLIAGLLGAQAMQPKTHVRIMEHDIATNFAGGAVGWLLVAWIIVSLVWVIRRGALGRRPAGMCIWIAVTAVILSFGPVVHLNGAPLAAGPEIILAKLVPGFSGMRVPGRLGLVAQVFVAIAAGIFLASPGLWRGPARWRGWRGWALSIVVIVGLCIELIPMTGVGASSVGNWIGIRPGPFVTPLRAVPYAKSAGQAAATRKLAEIEAARPDARILFVPMPPPDKDPASGTRALALAAACSGGQPDARPIRLRILNGYSGYFPPLFQRLRQELRGRWTDDHTRLLAELHVDYIVADRCLGKLPSGMGEAVGLDLVGDFGDVRIYGVKETALPAEILSPGAFLDVLAKRGGPVGPVRVRRSTAGRFNLMFSADGRDRGILLQTPVRGRMEVLDQRGKIVESMRGLPISRVFWSAREVADGGPLSAGQWNVRMPRRPGRYEVRFVGAGTHPTVGFPIDVTPALDSSDAVVDVPAD